MKTHKALKFLDIPEGRILPGEDFRPGYAHERQCGLLVVCRPLMTLDPKQRAEELVRGFQAVVVRS